MIAHHYTFITILGRPALLCLPQLGYLIPLKPGDVVGFMAEQQLHQLVIDPDTPSDLDYQYVFTIWTDGETLGRRRTLQEQFQHVFLA